MISVLLQKYRTSIREYCERRHSYRNVHWFISVRGAMRNKQNIFTLERRNNVLKRLKKHKLFSYQAHSVDLSEVIDSPFIDTIKRCNQRRSARSAPRRARHTAAATEDQENFAVPAAVTDTPRPRRPPTYGMSSPPPPSSCHRNRTAAKTSPPPMSTILAADARSESHHSYN